MVSVSTSIINDIIAPFIYPACPPGTYKSLKNNSQCLSCPMNSASTVHGASICPCNGQYYRAPFETAVDVCTGDY